MCAPSVCVCGGGVLAGMEQSCNEQILEREREAEMGGGEDGGEDGRGWPSAGIQPIGGEMCRDALRHGAAAGKRVYVTVRPHSERGG